MPQDFANEYSMHTRTCGELRREHIGETVTLCGWVARRRDHGGLIFVDLRDRAGITQVVFDPDTAGDYFALGERMRPEWSIMITGFVRERPEDTANPNLPTGEVDVVITECKILNESVTPPFPLDDDIDTDEKTRMKWRYLDMRRTPVAEALRLRDNVTWAIRNALHKRMFTEIETPILGKSTPEGARDFVVPSRTNPGRFYALPQSPQLFKQLTQIGGMERYYQVARCFRDEDLRADRQPEFTQVDIEMSYVTEDDVMNMMEDVFAEVFEAVGVEVSFPLDSPARNFTPDGSFLASSHTQALTNANSASSSLYAAARVSTSAFSYTLRIPDDSAAAFLVLRLHFFPFAISESDLMDVVLIDDGFGYFEFRSAFLHLQERKYVASVTDGGEQLYILTPGGGKAIEILASSLPLSVRDKAERAALRVIAKIRRNASIKASHRQNEDGTFTVQLKICDKQSDQLSVEVLAMTRRQCELLEDNFRRRAETLYHELLLLLSGSGTVE